MRNIPKAFRNQTKPRASLLCLPQARFASLDLVDCLFDSTETDAFEHACAPPWPLNEKAIKGMRFRGIPSADESLQAATRTQCGTDIVCDAEGQDGERRAVWFRLTRDLVYCPIPAGHHNQICWLIEHTVQVAVFARNRCYAAAGIFDQFHDLPERL